jgi:uncharacterized protein (TIGR02172 family)
MTETLGKPIAYGRTAEIYAWHDGQVLKLFYEWFSLENVEIERRNTAAAHAAGLPVPAVGGIVRVDHRYGLEYERIHGKSLFKNIQHKPWIILRTIRRCVELMVSLHAIPAPADLPSQRQRLEENIQRAEALPAELRQKVMAALAGMPEGDRLCHGDFWPANILVTEQGEFIIDWFRATRGNPLADLAWTTNLVLGFNRTRMVNRQFLTFGSSMGSHLKNIGLQVLTRFCFPAYTNYYFKLHPGDQQEYHRWLAIVAAARLADNIPELEHLLLAQVERYL